MTPTIPKSLADLRHNPKNPRQIDAVALSGLGKSMELFGDLSGLVFNVRSGQLVAGHQRHANLPADARIEDYREASDDMGTVGYGDVLVNGQRWHLRLVDWDERTEEAANISANNPHIAGQFTSDVRDILKQLESDIPDIYDQTFMHKIISDLERPTSERDARPSGEAEYDLSPMPYENYHYVVLLFRNEIDWATAKEHFRLKNVTDPKNTKKIGMGYVIDGKTYLNEQLGHLWSPPSKS